MRNYIKNYIENFREVLSTWKWRGYNPFWKESGHSLIPHMNKVGIDYREYVEIFDKHGLDLFEIIKKLTIETMIEPGFVKLTDNEKAMIGANKFLQFIKQLKAEISIMDKPCAEETPE